jgi:hypothetical protein
VKICGRLLSSLTKGIKKPDKNHLLLLSAGMGKSLIKPDVWGQTLISDLKL